MHAADRSRCGKTSNKWPRALPPAASRSCSCCRPISTTTTLRLARWNVARCLAKPVKPAELGAATQRSAAAATHAAHRNPGQRTGRRTRSPRTILLAEDCLVNQEVAVGLLELQGHAVHVVNNGREAVDAQRRRRL